MADLRHGCGTDVRVPDGGLGPSEAELKAMLRGLAVAGIRAVIPDDVPGLLDLHVVQGQALVRDEPWSRLAALEAVLARLISTTRDDLSRRLAVYAFGTYTRELLSLEARLSAAARNPRIALSRHTLRKKPLDRLLTGFAARLHFAEGRYRYNDILNRPDIVDVATDEDLRRLDFYTVTAYWLRHAANDVDAALTAQAAGDADETRGFAESALWAWAKFLHFECRFNEEFFGLWTLRVSKEEVDLAELTRLAADAVALPPLLPRERSYLRTEVMHVLAGELYPFLQLLAGERAGRDCLSKWTDWLASCRCRDRPARHCRPHRFAQEAHRFYDLMSREVRAPYATDRMARFLTLPDVFGLWP